MVFWRLGGRGKGFMSFKLFAVLYIHKVNTVHYMLYDTRCVSVIVHGKVYNNTESCCTYINSVHSIVLRKFYAVHNMLYTVHSRLLIVHKLAMGIVIQTENKGKFDFIIIKNWLPLMLFFVIKKTTSWNKIMIYSINLITWNTHIYLFPKNKHISINKMYFENYMTN